MKSKKVICIDTNGDDKLIINKEYRGERYTKSEPCYYKTEKFYFIFNNKRLIELYPDYMFKTIKQFRL